MVIGLERRDDAREGDRARPALHLVKGGALSRVQLPRDEQAHKAPVEWWHFTAHLTEPRELTLVVSILKGTPRGLETLSGVAALVLAIDRARGTHQVEHFLRPLGLAYQEGHDGGFRFGFGGQGWLARRHSLTVGGSLGHYSIRSPALRLALELGQDTPAALFGDRGVMCYGPGAELAYYAHPQLRLSGELDGRPIAGSGWMEHQWGSASVREFRWRYLAIQLDSEEQVIAFETNHPRGTKRFVARVAPSGAVTELGSVELIARGGPSFRGLPLATTLRGPGIELEIDPLFEQQRVKSALTPWLLPEFFEGASSVRGTIDGERVSGLGMTELV
jgi:predicted secreted hydrolase